LPYIWVLEKFKSKTKSFKKMIHCKDCDGRCCKYIALEVDEPETKEDFDQLVWNLCHEGVSIYIDNDGDWIVEVKTKCRFLGDDHLCKIYETRPQLCRNHSMENCEVNGEGSPHKILFNHPDELKAYADLVLKNK